MARTEQENTDWRNLWEAYGAKLLLFARQQTALPDDAEDVVQEAFVRYWKLQQAQPELPTGLMFTFVRRIAIDQARKSDSRRAREAQAVDMDGRRDPWFEDPVQDRERREIIEAALRALPQAQREVLVLKVWGGLTFEEIGATLEVSPHTAASRYRYGLTQLRELLTPSQP